MKRLILGLIIGLNLIFAVGACMQDVSDKPVGWQTSIEDPTGEVVQGICSEYACDLEGNNCSYFPTGCGGTGGGDEGGGGTGGGGTGGGGYQCTPSSTYSFTVNHYPNEAPVCADPTFPDRSECGPASGPGHQDHIYDVCTCGTLGIRYCQLVKYHTAYPAPT